MASLFCIADPHLSEAVDMPMDVFGSRWSGHREKFLSGWRGTVSEEDTVVIPGDISWAMTLDEALPDLMLIDSLPGRKILLRGNHDYWWQSPSKIRKALDGSRISIVQNDSVLVGETAICGSRGWFPDPKKAPEGTDFTKLVAREALRLEMSLDHAEKNYCGMYSERLAFLHFPPVFRETVIGPIVDVLVRKNVKRCFYGHVHGAYDIPAAFSFRGVEFSVVSADYLDFVPKRIA